MGMKTRLASLLLAVLIASPALAAEKEVDSVYFNGQSWNRISRINPEWTATFKVFLVRGICEGMMAQNPELFYDISSRINYRTAVEKLDKFYEGGDNGAVPVTYALTSMMKDSGSKRKSSGTTLVSLENAGL
jgi:hypothetical protein